MWAFTTVLQIYNILSFISNIVFLLSISKEEIDIILTGRTMAILISMESNLTFALSGQVVDNRVFT